MLGFLDSHAFSRQIYAVAAVSGFVGVATGAVGAHGLRGKREELVQIFKTASTYQLFHSLAALHAATLGTRTGNLASLLFMAGTTLFCGACYTYTLTENRVHAQPAPWGGLMLMGGWLCLAAGAVLRR